MRLNQIFIDEPSLRPYFFEVEESIPKGMEQKAKAIAWATLNIYESIWARRSSMDKDVETAWRHYICEHVPRVPLLRSIYSEHRDWYPTLKQIVKLD